MGIFYGVATETLLNKLMANSPESRANSRDWRRGLALDPPTIGDKVTPAKPRAEYRLGEKRVSTGEGSPNRAPTSGGRRVGHGEPPPRLAGDRESMARKQIYRNLGLSCPDEDEELDDEDEELGKAFDDEMEGAVARVKPRKTVKASAGLQGLVVGSQGCSLKIARDKMVAMAIAYPGGVNDQVLRNLALGTPWRGPCPD